MNTNEGNTQRSRPKISCDQEAWLLDRLSTLVGVSRNIVASRTVGADEPACGMAIDGAIHGTANEILRTLGLTCDWINIREDRT